MTKRIKFRHAHTSLRGFLAAARRHQPARHRRANQARNEDKTDSQGGRST